MSNETAPAPCKGRGHEPKGANIPMTTPTVQDRPTALPSPTRGRPANSRMGGVALPGDVATRGARQRFAALAKANRVRSARARLRQGLRRISHADGRDLAVSVLRDPGEDCAGMTVEYLLMSIRWMGRTKTQAICRRIGIRPTARIGNLRDDDRDALVAKLRRAGR